jgi:hypothetical protein
LASARHPAVALDKGNQRGPAFRGQVQQSGPAGAAARGAWGRTGRTLMPAPNRGVAFGHHLTPVQHGARQDHPFTLPALQRDGYRLQPVVGTKHQHRAIGAQSRRRQHRHRLQRRLGHAQRHEIARAKARGGIKRGINDAARLPRAHGGGAAGQPARWW